MTDKNPTPAGQATPRPAQEREPRQVRVRVPRRVQVRVPKRERQERVREMLELVGLESLATGGEEGPGDEALALLEARNAARAAKDWARADEIRDSLAELGWEVRDGAEGARLVPRS